MFLDALHQRQSTIEKVLDVDRVRDVSFIDIICKLEQVMQSDHDLWSVLIMMKSKFLPISSSDSIILRESNIGFSR